MTIKEIGWRIIASSADPKKVGLAARGIVLLIGSQIVKASSVACDFGLSCIGVTLDHVNVVAETVDTITYGAMLVVGGIWFLWGIARKAYLGQWNAIGK